MAYTRSAGLRVTVYVSTFTSWMALLRKGHTPRFQMPCVNTQSGAPADVFRWLCSG